jgi:hypothetical protein
LLGALAKGREERFQRAGAFAAALRRALLAESLAGQREAQLAALYEQLQAAAAREDWAEVLALGGQIRALDAGYRDVPELMERARARMRRPGRGWTRENAQAMLAAPGELHSGRFRWAWQQAYHPEMQGSPIF